MEYAIDIENLNYIYNNKFKALDNISIQVPRGSVFGFLGPNGAGKSTTMRMLAGLMYDEENKIKIFDKPIRDQIPSLYQRVGCLVEQPVLYRHLTAKDHLELIIRSNELDMDRIDPVLELVGLSHAKKLSVKRYSLGMKQRLAIGLCLVKNPDILLLDEPVNGLDPNGMQEIRELLVRLNQENGVTVFISSHLLAEIEKMCSHIAIINRGKIHFQGTMQELKTKFEGTPVKIKIDSSEPVQLTSEYDFFQDGNYLTFQIDSQNAIPLLIRELTQSGIGIYEVKQEGNLESWFMDIIK